MDPPVVVGSTGDPLDLAIFNRTVDLPALVVPARKVGELQKGAELKALLYRRRGIRNVLPSPNGNDQQRLVLLQEGLEAASLPGSVQQWLKDGVAELVRHDLCLGYEHV